MDSAKSIRLKPIDARAGQSFIRRHHYSGKVAKAQWLYLGVHDGERLIGCLTFGRPIDIRKAMHVLDSAHWDSILELGRMTMIDRTPRNVESRALAVAIREIRRRYPHYELVQTYADGAQCGDGTIYRAAGFDLVGIKRNNQIWANPEGNRVERVTVTISNYAVAAAGASTMKPYIEAGYRPIPGYQLRYVKCLRPGVRERLTVPILPYSEIARRGAGMYKGRPKDSSEPHG